MQRHSCWNSSIALKGAVAQLLRREFKPPPGMTRSGQPAPASSVADADVALLIKRHGNLSLEGFQRRLIFEAMFQCEHNLSERKLSIVPALLGSLS
jgi:hypothetical protein